MRFVFVFLIIFFNYLTPDALAQDNSMLHGNQPLNIDLSPLYPGPEETFTATINDYALPISSTEIRWFIDGELQTDHINERKISTTTKAVGQKTTIEAVLTLSSGNTISAKRLINPVYLDIIIEPQTRTPAFYKGRALPSIGSLINATALINGNTIPPSDLLYSWRVNDEVLNGGAMRGKNVITFNMPRGRYAVLSLNVQNLSGETLSRHIFELPSVSPDLSFYTSSPLYGLATKAVRDTIPLISDSFSIRAEPYYLDLRTYNDPNLLEWKLNGTRSAGGNTNPYEITLAKNESLVLGGKTTINFHVRNTTQVLQGAAASFVVSY